MYIHAYYIYTACGYSDVSKQDEMLNGLALLVYNTKKAITKVDASALIMPIQDNILFYNNDRWAIKYLYFDER